MNAETHLDLEDLISEAAGQAIGDRAREHLAGCEHCQLEANRWNLVAGGIRALAAAAPETSAPESSARESSARESSAPEAAAAESSASGAAEPARPRRTMLAGPRRRALLAVGAAAALVLAGYGVGAALSGPGPGPGTGTVLTVVTGCTRLEQAAGTLEQVNGTSVVIKTIGGQLVTVTTTPTTRMSASGALVRDITDGAPVTVEGPSSGGRIAADFVVLGKPSLAALPGLVVVQGTAADASAGGFTIITSAGTRLPVTTSGSTPVTVFNASLSQLQPGSSTIAVGYAGPHGTLRALAVLQPPSWPPGAHATVTVRDCSPASINRVITALASGI